MWPFAERDRTSFITPGKRIAEVAAIADQATGTDDLAQQQLTHELARRIQTEPDPLVREAVIRAMSEFRTPMADRVLLAGLKDADERVRIACCRAIGTRRNEAFVPPLAGVLRDAEDLDVRLAAAAALGDIGSDAALAALVVALDDRDPALQYAGVQAMRSASDENLGNEVAAWRQYAIALAPGASVQQASASLTSPR